MSVFKPILDALPRAQRTLWEEMRGAPADFVLYGGTALALRLGHRQSEDFDFFSTKAFEPSRVLSTVTYLGGAKVVREEKNTLTCAVDRGGEIRVSFFGGLPLCRVDDPDIAQNHVQVASLLDLAGCKAEVVQHRAEAKDYRDIAALLAAGVGLAMILAAGRAVYGEEFAPGRTLRALTFFEDGNLPEMEQSIRVQLRDAVAAVNLEQLPALAGREGLTRQENKQ